MFVLALLALSAQTLKVGPGQTYTTIESAFAAAQEGDTVEIYPQPGGYHRTAVRITTANLKIIGKSDSPVLIDGDGFDYSGVGNVPRAIFQVDPPADQVTIRNFELTGAHNASYNGAGIRINGANMAIVDHCDIHNNDMGIMSAAFNETSAAAGQRITESHIHHNGAAKDPGYNHNLYLAGRSVYLKHCEVDHSITGHNLKSRAWWTEAEDCYFHDAANREIDLVEGQLTLNVPAAADFYNCVIAKDPKCSGNRGVIHFGPEKGVWPGRLRLVCCTIITDFSSPVVLLTDKSPAVEFDYSIFLNISEAHPTLVAGQPIAGDVTGRNNWLSSGYDLDGTAMDTMSRMTGKSRRENLRIAPPTFKPWGLPTPEMDPIDRQGPMKTFSIVIYPADRYGARWTPLNLQR